MSAARWPVLGLCLILVACGPSSEASLDLATGSPEPSASATQASTPTLEPTPEPTSRPTPQPSPSETPAPFVPYFPPVTPEPIALPDGLDAFAWAVVVTESKDADGLPTSYRLFAGRLGSGPTHVESITADQGWITVRTDGDVVAVVRQTEESTHIDVRRIDGWQGVQSFDVSGWARYVLLDAPHEAMYAALPRADLGLDILRLDFSGTVTTLLGVDGDFAEVPFPDDLFTMAVDADGVLMVSACKQADGCELWFVPRAAPLAGSPISLPAGTPMVCNIIGATTEVVVVYDHEVCYIDFWPASFPMRTISRTDGSNQLVSAAENTFAWRVIEVDGRALAVATSRSDDWTTNDVLTIDIVTGGSSTVASKLFVLADGDGALTVDRRTLTRSWVLLTPSSFTDGAAPPHARLVNIESGTVIELPLGTFAFS